MTLPTDRTTTGSASRTTPRLRLKPKAPATGYVDGAWWPCSNDLLHELPDLLAVLSVRLGTIERVIYNLREWSATPSKLDTENIAVRLGGYNHQPVDTIEVIGLNRRRIHLLVVPSGIDPDRAHTILMSAAMPGDTSPVAELLHRNTVDAR